MACPMPSTMAVKIYFDIKDEQNVLYRSIRIQCSTTFADLHSKISEKIGISKSRSVFFRIALRYDSPVSQLRRDLYPPVCELVAPTVAREETAWVGEVFLVFIDTRPPSRRLVETASANEEVQRLAAGSSSKLAASPMTEFFFHSEGTDKFSAITESILTEVENVCVKRGKLLKVSQWKESVHREVAVFVDQTRLWLSRGAEGDHALSYVELAAVDAFVTVDEGSYAFAVRSVTGTSTVFKAKSRAEMKEWRVAIEQRSDAVSENNLIAMADDHIAQNELDRVEDNMLTLRSLSEFRGTLCNRYLRRRFRIYLENNDEGNLLLFWEYAEDFKLCHSTTHRFEQHDRSRPICINGQQAWPHDYQCSPAESKAFAVFIFDTFLAQGAQHPLHSEKISADQVEAVNILLQKAPRTLFVSLQASVMRELMQLFYQDFARAQRYREYFVAASMDLFGCFETESAEAGAIAPGLVAAMIDTPAPTMSPRQLTTPSTAGRPHRNSFSMPFRANSSNGAFLASKHASLGLRKATSLDNPTAGTAGDDSSLIMSPKARAAGGIAFSTPTKDAPSSPMSFVFTPSPQAPDAVVAATPASASVAPEKKGWFSNLRLFKKDALTTVENQTNGAVKTVANLSIPQPALSNFSHTSGGSSAKVTASPGMDEGGPYIHPLWKQQHTVDVSIPCLTDAWWQGKAPAMERYLDTLCYDNAGHVDGLALYRSYAQWAPGQNVKDILSSVRSASTAESVVQRWKTTSPWASPSSSFAHVIGDTADSDYVLSPIQNMFDQLDDATIQERSSQPLEPNHHSNKHLIEWKGSHGHKSHRLHRKHHKPQLYKRTSESSGDHSHRCKTEFVVTADSVELLEAGGDSAMTTPPGRQNRLIETLAMPQPPLYIPIGTYSARVAFGSSGLSTIGNQLSKPVSCAPYAFIFSTPFKLTIRGVSISWSSVAIAALKTEITRTSFGGSPNGFSTPSTAFNDRGSISVSGKTKGGNIFMNRKTEAATRLGELSRQNEVDAGRLKGEAFGMVAGAAAPWPQYLGGLRGQILLWSPVRARYLKYAPQSVQGASSSSVASSNASQASTRASYQSAQKVGASPRHLSTSRGLADLTIGTANFPPLPLESEAIPAQITKPLLQEREIEHSDVVRYYALLLLCPEGHCNVLLYSISMSGIEEPHIRAIINLHKATLLSPSSLNAFNIHDESGLIWTIFPEGVDDDDSRAGSKLWLDLIRKHTGDQKGPKVVGIIYEGYLAKRGLLNTAFRRRWFILNSKHQLRYFKEESGQCKGEISISQVLNIEIKERELSLHTKNRLWVLQADSEQEAKLWAAAIRTMMPIPGSSAEDVIVDGDHGDSFIDDD